MSLFLQDVLPPLVPTIPRLLRRSPTVPCLRRTGSRSLKVPNIRWRKDNVTLNLRCNFKINIVKIGLTVAKQLQNCSALINYILEAVHAIYSKCNMYVDFISYLPVLDPLSMCDMSTISCGSVTPLKGVRHSTPGKAGWNKVCGQV